MSRVYISNVNLPVPRSISRYLAHTVVGSRKGAGEGGDEEGEEAPKFTYEITGSLSPKTANDSDDSEQTSSRPSSGTTASIKPGISSSDAAATKVATVAPVVPAVGAPIEGSPADGSAPAAAPPTNQQQPGTAAAPATGEVVAPVAAAPTPVKLPAILATRRGVLSVADRMPESRRAKPKWVKNFVSKQNREELKTVLNHSDIIIYDITEDWEEAAWAVQYLAENEATFKEQGQAKTFVAVSSVLSWAKSKYESEDPEATLTEDDYRRRKPHPNYKNQTDVEKEVIKLGKDGFFKTYVVAAGVVFHPDDCLFHPYFKAAWQGAPHLFCYGDGSNFVPTIHLTDLSNIVVEIVDANPEKRYIVAVDDSKSTMFQIIKTISDHVGNGQVVKVGKEQALLNKKISQMDFDLLQINMRLDPVCIKEFNYDWKFEAGFVENIKPFTNEYKEYRNLTPLRITIHGAPYSGKTMYAKKLAEYYELPYLSAETIVKSTLEAMEKRVNEPPIEGGDPELEVTKEKYQELKEAMAKNNDRVPDDQINQMVRDELRSIRCRNRGYVLDNYPTTTEEATTLYMPTGEEEELPDGTTPTVDPLTFPGQIVSFELSDEVIKERVMELPESETVGTRNAEEALVKRLEEFRKVNTVDNTLLNYYDEKELIPIVVSTETQTPEQVFQQIIAKIGKPHNYGPTEEQIAQTKLKQAQEKLQKLALAEEERTARAKEEAERKARALEEWNQRLAEVRKQEAEMLEAKSAPLRGYLVKHVMPTLTAALIDVCKVRPEDPIDYLAEYLFQRNEKNSALP